jgi:hypothetical protein
MRRPRCAWPLIAFALTTACGAKVDRVPPPRRLAETPRDLAPGDGPPPGPPPCGRRRAPPTSTAGQPPDAAGGGGVSAGRRASLGRSVRLGRGTRADRVGPRSAAGRGGGTGGVCARRDARRSAARVPGRPDRSSVAGAAGGRGSRPGAAGGDRREAGLRLGADGAGAARPRRPRQPAAVRMRARGAGGRGFASMLVARGAGERAGVEALRGDRGGRDGDDRARRGRAREGVVGIPPPGLGRRVDVAQRREGDDQIEPMTEGGEPSVGGGAGVLGTGEHVFVRLGRGSDGRGRRARRLAPLSGIPRPTAIGRISHHRRRVLRPPAASRGSMWPRGLRARAASALRPSSRATTRRRSSCARAR